MVMLDIPGLLNGDWADNRLKERLRDALEKSRSQQPLDQRVNLVNLGKVMSALENQKSKLEQKLEQKEAIVQDRKDSASGSDFYFELPGASKESVVCEILDDGTHYSLRVSGEYRLYAGGQKFSIVSPLPRRPREFGASFAAGVLRVAIDYATAETTATPVPIQ